MYLSILCHTALGPNLHDNTTFWNIQHQTIVSKQNKPVQVMIIVLNIEHHVTLFVCCQQTNLAHPWNFTDISSVHNIPTVC